jgi:polyferredoxin
MPSSRLRSWPHIEGLKEVIRVKFVLAGLALVLALPVLLVIAIALGPVILGVLCAVGFGLIVFTAGNVLAGGRAPRSLRRKGRRPAHIHHS